ncbi:adaptor protein MecA [Brevibacillus ginsengisoli]|uniref:adaptor protein MecA n=1 Tax=Brevibacillus ginsengisoli TaxID=363854 RepID=UPI003CEB615D
MEIVDNQTITIYISEAELSTRGFDIHNHESNLTMINHFVDEALLFAESTHDFPALDMPSRTDVAYVPSQGLYITIKLTEEKETTEIRRESHLIRTGLSFAFRDFEDLTLCAAKLPERLQQVGKLYVYNGTYTLLVTGTEFTSMEDYLNACAIIEDYAQQIDVTVEMVETYGKVIMEKDAFREIKRLFPC